MIVQPVVEQLAVLVIVSAAAVYSARQLVPAFTWRRLARAIRGAPMEPSVANLRQPHPGCHGCPASADCGKRR